MCASRLRRLSQAVTRRLLVESNNFCGAIRGAEERHFASRAAPASAPVGAASLFQENDAEPVFARIKKSRYVPGAAGAAHECTCSRAGAVLEQRFSTGGP